MLDTFSARLEARDPAKGHFRSYRVHAGIDLLGNWTVEVTFGRIGSAGHRIRYCAQHAREAQRIVKQSLRRRASAKRRFGTSYRFIELYDPQGWFSPELCSRE
jgi:hypothetical protein